MNAKAHTENLSLKAVIILLKQAVS